MINIGILVRKVFIKKMKINPIIKETKLKVFITIPVLGNVKDTPKQKDKVVSPNRKEINGNFKVFFSHNGKINCVITIGY